MSVRKYTKETNEEIARRYVEEGVSAKILCEIYGYKTTKSITDKVKKYYPEYDFRQTRQRKTTYYGLSFEKINNPELAYFIGLLLTDGYVGKDRLQVGLDLLDKDCIEFLAEHFNFKVQEYARPPYENKYRITFDGKEYIEQLKRFGITPQKSLKLSAPELLEDEEKFLPYIIRGIIDGDGSVYNRSMDGFLEVSICSASESFIQWIVEVLKNKLFIESDCSIRKQKNGKGFLYQISISRREDVEKIKILCYSRPMGMQRKRKKLFDQTSETKLEGANLIGS